MLLGFGLFGHKGQNVIKDYFVFHCLRLKVCDNVMPLSATEYDTVFTLLMLDLKCLGGRKK